MNQKTPTQRHARGRDSLTSASMPGRRARQVAKAEARGDSCHALTVHPVWAWAIVHGYKPVENRVWRTNYRGRLLIHASSNSTAAKKSDLVAREELSRLGINAPAEVPTAAIVGAVDLVDVQPLDVVDHVLATGPHCWLLARPKAFAKPVPLRGKQRIFSIRSPLFHLRSQIGL